MMGLTLRLTMLDNTEISKATDLEKNRHITAVNAFTESMKGARHAIVGVIIRPEESRIKGNAKLRREKHGNDASGKPVV